MRVSVLLLCSISSVSAFAQTPDALVIADFEAGAWEGLQQSTDHVKQGQFSGRWANLKQHASLRAPQCPTDWSQYDRLVFWMYSEQANDQRLTLVCNSENTADAEGWDYFFHHFKVDWEGWRLMNLRLGEDIRPTRKPVGWHQIDYFSLNATSWQNTPLPDTVLHFDDLKLVRDPVRLELIGPATPEVIDGRRVIAFELNVQNRSAQARAFELSVSPRAADDARPPVYQVKGVPERTSAIPPNDTLSHVAVLEASEVELRNAQPLTREEFVIQVKSDDPDLPGPEAVVSGAVPLPKRKHPFLFADAETIARAKARAEQHDWAKKQLEGIISGADRILEAELNVPDEPGQWGHHYVCKQCGARLRHQDGEHICQKCGAKYTGWPYDQVIIAGIHGRNWRDVRTLGLAYALTGDERYAERARQNLLAYAEKYMTYPIHNVRGKVSRSGGRVFAQTLDESVAIIGVAWGYDLIHNSPCLSAEDQEQIETGFLRQVVETIRRNDAGISNWQSWHNAGVAAVGFCLQDEEIASQAINGRSGLRFQLQKSILSDGFWYEGTAAYHYYALDALRWTTEAAFSAGITFYDHPAYKSLYDAPLMYTFPDLSFPAVNDSDVFSIKGRHALYDLAYTRFGDPKYLVIAHAGSRNSLEAFLWGPDELPAAPEVALQSKDFTGLGAAVLRQGSGEDQLYVHFDYGPHGGGHGHPDKLTMILFGLGRQLAPDPARLAYGAPLQGSWYRQTFAHNTICVDGQSQKPTTGKLTLFHSTPGLALAEGTCDTAYPGVAMKRALALTDSYVIDIFSVSSEEEHTYDWLHHNFGEVSPGLPTTPRVEPLAEGAGYQHMTDITQAQTGEAWSADFRQEGASVRLTMLGAPGTELFFGMGMASNPPQPCPMLVARRKGTVATFISVIEPYRDTPTVSGLKLVPVIGDEGAVALEITRGADRDLFMLADKPGVPHEFAGLQTTARAHFVRFQDGQPTAIHQVE